MIASGTLPVANGVARLESKLDTPGTLLGLFTLPQADAKSKPVMAGAVIEPY